MDTTDAPDPRSELDDLRQRSAELEAEIARLRAELGAGRWGWLRLWPRPRERREIERGIAAVQADAKYIRERIAAIERSYNMA